MYYLIINIIEYFIYNNFILSKYNNDKLISNILIIIIIYYSY